jgi:hypothetical protein
MDERTKNLVMAIIGITLGVVTLACLIPLVYLEVSQRGTVSTQLAGLLAIPLAASAALIKSALTSAAKEQAKASTPPSQGDA